MAAWEILYEDNHLLIVNKPAGLLVQADRDHSDALEEQVKRFIQQRDHKPGNVYLGVPHRLDRPVSGLVILSKTSKALVRLNEKFRNGEIHKIYHAIVKHTPANPQNTLVHYIFRNEKQNKSYALANAQSNAKEAKLRYRVLDKSKTFTLLEIELLTGRHHQIRAQLAAIGCPIKGDLKYGFPRSNPGGGISLHARSVSFEHPVTKEQLILAAPYPDTDVWNHFGEK